MSRQIPVWSALAAALFLAPVLGGQVAADVRPLAPGLAGLWTGVFGGEAPVTAHAFLGFLVFGALGFALGSRRVVQLPTARIAAPLLLFTGLLVLSLLQSSHRAASATAMAEWGAYVAAFFAAIALSGRVSGPRTLAAALVAGCTWVALKGLVEYGQMRAVDPSWRIFAGWVNANALAGMLLLGLPVALALAATQKRLAALAAGAAAALIALALLLTQSKGGLLCAAVGVGLFALLAVVAAPRESRARSVLRTGAVLVAAAALGGLLLASQRAPSGSGPAPAQALSRVGDVSDTQAQSFTFRKLLWRGAVELTAKRPIGTGLGTYRFHSAEPGLTPQTHFAHQSFLQLAVEASPAATVALALFGLLVLGEALRRSRSGVPEAVLLRFGLVSALLASAGHSLMDSDLYHFGIGLCFFALAGLATQLGSDAVTPEYLRPAWRRVGLAGVAAGCVGLLLASVSELSLARLVHALGQGNAEAARAALDSAKTWASWEGETWRMATALEPDAGKRATLLSQAARLSPTPRNYRALAREQLRAGRSADAEVSLARALSLDPNNLAALAQRMAMRLDGGDRSGAVEDARRLVAVETTPYFQVRALPEIVPTETYEARSLLAADTRDDAEAAALLAPAVEGYREFAAKTVPLWKAHVEAGAADPGRLMESREVLERATADARRLAALYRSLGRASDAASAEEAASAFDALAFELPTR